MPWYAPWRHEAPRLSVLDPPGELPKKAPGGSMVSSMAPPGEWGATHPGWGLTADRIRGAFMQAEQGFPAQQCDNIDDVIERDGHVRSLVEGHIDSVAGKPWIMQAGDDADGADEAALRLGRAVRRIANANEAWEHMLTADFYGWAGVEVQWERVDGWTVPVWFACVPHRRFRFELETDEPRLLVEDDYLDGKPLQRGRWIFATRRHRHTVRAGLMRTVTWWAWLKSLSVRDWQIFCARFGLPFVIARYEDDSDEELIAQLKQAVLAFGKNGGAVFSSKGVIEVKEPGSASAGGQSVHGALAALCDREISKCISGATLTSGEGTSVGSYALGRVHQDRSFDKTVASAERLSSIFSAQLGAAFLHFNGKRSEPPRPKFRIVREVDPVARMNIIDVAVNKLGLEVDADQVRDEYDLKRPTGEALKGAPQLAPGAPPAPTDAPS